MRASMLFQWNEAHTPTRWLMAGLLGLLPITAQAADPIRDTLQVHGFLSQALVITDDNDFFGASSDHAGSLEYTELGLNASFRLITRC